MATFAGTDLGDDFGSLRTDLGAEGDPVWRGRIVRASGVLRGANAAEVLQLLAELRRLAYSGDAGTFVDEQGQPWAGVLFMEAAPVGRWIVDQGTGTATLRVRVTFLLTEPPEPPEAPTGL